VRRRLFWLALGVVGGYLLLRRLGVVSAGPSELAGRAATRAAGLAGDRAQQGVRSVIGTVREFADDVRANAAAREAELRDALTADVTDPESAARAEEARLMLEHPHSPADRRY
jgi:hypothetical protein